MMVCALSFNVYQNYGFREKSFLPQIHPWIPCRQRSSTVLVDSLSWRTASLWAPYKNDSSLFTHQYFGISGLFCVKKIARFVFLSPYYWQCVGFGVSFSDSAHYLSIDPVSFRARIFKRLWSPGIDSKEWIPQAYVAWRAGTITLFLLGS